MSSGVCVFCVDLVLGWVELVGRGLKLSGVFRASDRWLRSFRVWGS